MKHNIIIKYMSASKFHLPFRLIQGPGRQQGLAQYFWLILGTQQNSARKQKFLFPFYNFAILCRGKVFLKTKNKLSTRF